MISFFRKALTSWYVLALFGLILVAFVVTGFGSPAGLESMALSGDRVAKVGSASIEAAELSKRLQNRYEAERQNNPALTKTQFLQAGTLEGEIDQLVLEAAIDQFMEDEDISISRRMVDRELDKIPSLRGPTGKFDPVLFQNLLRENGLTEDQVRQQFARQLYSQMVEMPAGFATILPDGVTQTYVRMALERREGQIATISAVGFDNGPAPTDAEISAFYASNGARYTVPETRVVRYALISPDRFKGKVQPSDADVAAAYKAAGARFARVEKRVLTQAIVQSAEAAKALVRSASSGDFAAAARTAKVQPTTLKLMDKAGYAAIATAPAIADAAFAAKQGDVVDAGKSALGWHVVKVDRIEVTGGKSLEQARAELLPDLIKRKEADALHDFVLQLEDQIDDGATMDDVAKAHALELAETPAVTAGGIAPDNAGFKLPSQLAPVLKEAFQADMGDDPLVAALDTTSGLSALYELRRINPSAPRPLAQIRDQVRADLVADRASKAAKKAANAVLAKVNKGMTLAAAMQSENAGSARPISGTRAQLQADSKLTGLEALFDLARGKARLTELPGRQGYAIVALDRIIPGDPASNREVAFQLPQQLMRQTGSEYGRQFFNAVSRGLGVEREDEAIQRLRRGFTNPGGQ